MYMGYQHWKIIFNVYGFFSVGNYYVWSTKTPTNKSSSINVNDQKNKHGGRKFGSIRKWSEIY